ncbi:MAG: YigZ family protein [Calditrichaeota bacterium]|nr:MAG: YigZ family protein [Calditrichota bacterium]
MAESESESYFTPEQLTVAEYRVKDSRFIAHLAPTDSKETAENFVREIASKYADATHHCFAYRLGVGDSAIYRADDAGEPAGTAGRPILQALESRSVSDAVLVVTRYFRGTKLGIGGLIRAYRGAALAVIDPAPLIEVLPKVIRKIAYAYKYTGAVHKVLNQFGAVALNMSYEEMPVLEYSVVRKNDEPLREALLNATSGKIQFL